MAKRQIMLTFPEKLIGEPIIYNMGHQFNLITNIRHSNIWEGGGWVSLELEGEEEEIEKSIAWATSKGVKVDPVQY